MNKQKSNYNFARLRLTSYSNRKNNDGKEKLEISKQNFVFSNLLNNYDRIQKLNNTVSPMFLAKFMPKSAKNSKIFDLIIKKLPRNNSDQHHCFTQRKCLTSESRRHSNTSQYQGLSISKRFYKKQRNENKIIKTTTQLSKSQLLVPCRVTSIKIQKRDLEMSNNYKQFHQSPRFKRKKHNPNQRIVSQLLLNKKNGDQIEPWGMKNYESIIL